MRRLLWITAIAGFAIAGCGGDDPTPVACLEGKAAYLHALRSSTPGAVRLDDGTPISGCLVKNQAAGELATVGAGMVDTATRLNSAAQVEPGRATTLQLGYLLGAAHRGADDNEGIDAELIRRLEAAAHYSPDGEPWPADFLRAYRRGFRAGQERG